MTDDLLTDYVSGQLGPVERARVCAAVSADPAVAARLDRIARVVDVLRSPEPVEPPAGLVRRTLAAVIPPVVPASLRRAASYDTPLFFGRRRVDVVVAAGLTVLACGLLLGVLQKTRYEASVLACKNTLRGMYWSLDGYSQTHNGRYPQVGVSGAPTAGGFVTKLVEEGYWTADASIRCPAMEPGTTTGVGYTYALGYQAPGGGLVGLRRPDPILGTHDRLALGGDFPAVAVAPAGGPFSPHGRGQNILFAGGNVMFTTSADVGVDGDDVYRNATGRVGAGLFAGDVCLGRPDDRP
jgi:hypothetical protein